MIFSIKSCKKDKKSVQYLVQGKCSFIGAIGEQPIQTYKNKSVHSSDTELETLGLKLM